MRLTLGLSRAGTQDAARTGTVFKDRRRSYGELLDRVPRFAAGLHKLGVKPGDRIALIALNSDRYYEAYYACLWAGCSVVPGNTRWAAAEHGYAMKDSEPALVLSDRTFGQLSAGLAAEAGIGHVIIDDDDGGTGAPAMDALIAGSEPIADHAGSNDAMAGIFYTGGTTGWPKGVMLSHGGLIANFALTALITPYPQETVFLHSPPMFHMADAAVIFGLTPLAATHVIVPGFDPAGVVAAIQSERVNALVLVPTMLNMLGLHLAANPADLGVVQRVVYGASAISEATLKRALSDFPNAKFSQAYGQTELSPVATILEPRFHGEAGAKAGLLRSAGRAIPYTELRVVDADKKPVPQGEVGEVAVKGPNTMLGYWKKPEVTAATLVDGWVHTGDAGYLNAEGFLFLVDRVKDMIVSGGENVYSAEVENALHQHAAVAECAVIGVPDETWGERVHAVVRLKPGQAVDETALTTHCTALIATYKRPRSYEFRVEPLPLSGAGKILKTELRRPFWEGATRSIG